MLASSDIATQLGIRNRTSLELLYATAIRNTEFRELQTGDVDLERLELFVARGRGGKSRRLPFGEEAAAWLEDYLLNVRPLQAAPGSGQLLFLSTGGRKIDRGRLSIIVRKAAAAWGLDKHVTPHLSQVFLKVCQETLFRCSLPLGYTLGYAGPETAQVVTWADHRLGLCCLGNGCLDPWSGWYFQIPGA